MKKLLVFLFLAPIFLMAQSPYSRTEIHGGIKTYIRQGGTYSPIRIANILDTLNASMVNLGGSYSDPSWITSLVSSKITWPVLDGSFSIANTDTPTKIATFDLSNLSGTSQYSWPDFSGHVIVSGGINELSGNTTIDVNGNDFIIDVSSHPDDFKITHSLGGFWENKITNFNGVFVDGYTMALFTGVDLSGDYSYAAFAVDGSDQAHIRAYHKGQDAHTDFAMLGDGGSLATPTWSWIILNHATSQGMVIDDQRTSPWGLHYANDYSAGFVTNDRALPDVGWVKSGTATFTNKTWNGGIISGQYGGTGVANTGKTITVSGNIVIGSSTHTVSFLTSGATSVTLPTSGTLIGTSGLTSTRLLIAGSSSSATDNANLTWESATNTLRTPRAELTTGTLLTGINVGNYAGYSSSLTIGDIGYNSSAQKYYGRDGSTRVDFLHQKSGDLSIPLSSGSNFVYGSDLTVTHVAGGIMEDIAGTKSLSLNLNPWAAATVGTATVVDASFIDDGDAVYINIWISGKDGDTNTGFGGIYEGRWTKASGTLQLVGENYNITSDMSGSVPSIYTEDNSGTLRAVLSTSGSGNATWSWKANVVINKP